MKIIQENGIVTTEVNRKDRKLLVHQISRIPKRCKRNSIYYLFIIALFKVGVQTQLIANKNQLTEFTKCSPNVKREVTCKMIHPESISNVVHISSILTNHIATSQQDTIKSQVPGDQLIIKNTTKNKNYVEVGSKCATFYISCTRSQYFWFF